MLDFSYQIKEALWTDHFDSDNPEIGFNYYRGPPAWGWTREGGSYITKSDLVQGILEGLSYEEMAADNRFNKKTSQMRNYIQKYIKDDQGNVVKGIEKARIVLIKPYLMDAITEGLDVDGVIDYLNAHGVTLIDKLHKDKNAGLNKYLKENFGWTFTKCREEWFIKPEMERLLAEGYFIPGLGTEEILPSDFSDLLDRIYRRPVRTTHLGTPTIGLGLIEKLMLNGIRGTELTKVLGLSREGDNQAARNKAQSNMRSYFRHRWNIALENDVYTFLVTHFLLGDD